MNDKNYDDDNIFQKIINKTINTEIIYEDEFALAFNDIKPVAPIHVLIIPKVKVITFDDFVNKCSLQYVANFFSSVRDVINQLQLVRSGYRMITNSGKNGSQEVGHFHIHIISGKVIGPLIVK